MVGVKKKPKLSYNYAKISPKMVKPRDIAVNAEEEEDPSYTAYVKEAQECPLKDIPKE